MESQLYKASGIVFAILFLQFSCTGSTSDRELYIAYLGHTQQHSTTGFTANSQFQLISSIFGSENRFQEALKISYTKSFSGFAAMLTPEEVQRLKATEGVVSVVRSALRKVETTRSWDFIGLTGGSPRNPTTESDIVIGIIDTGIWPESESFSDENFRTTPPKWRGECESGAEFNSSHCNRKLIGARFYTKGYEAEFGLMNGSEVYKSPRDSDGHGTHTASIAGGNIVRDANLFGLANGNARGAVPGARIAVYKVCWTHGCSDADILAAFDDAIHDGVDFLSVSLGVDTVQQYFDDVVSIASYHAMKKGILVSGSAGNSGQTSAGGNNVAPWIFTVAASSIDRQFYSPIMLRNNDTIKGKAINTFRMEDPWYGFITGIQAARTGMEEEARFCEIRAVDPSKVKGKIVFCKQAPDGTEADEMISRFGGAGTVLVLNKPEAATIAYTFVASASAIDEMDATKIREYLNGTKFPQARILPCEEAKHDHPAPLLAYFSSRGPNAITPEILKPDITAPGVEILASWSPKGSISGVPTDTRHSLFNIATGTSMACPHVTGAAAYVKSFHPDWSPAAIKSALMTTATPLDPTKKLNQDLEFGYGAGQINPLKAAHPGLVYDAGEKEYITFLCSNGYNTSTLRRVTGDDSVCQMNETTTDLNYASVSAPLTLNTKDNWTVFRRSVTNVGTPKSVYTSKIQVPQGLEVVISPNTLSFTALKQQQSFDLRVRAAKLGPGTPKLSGSLLWTDGLHEARSPIIAWLWQKPSNS